MSKKPKPPLTHFVHPILSTKSFPKTPLKKTHSLLKMASLSNRLKSHHLKLHHRHHQQHLLTFSHFYSSSSSSNNDDNNNNDGNTPKTPSFPWSDIKSKLSQHQQQQQKQQQQQRSSLSPNGASFDEIRKNLSEFRMRSSDFTPPKVTASSPPPRPISLQGLYNKNTSKPTPLSMDSIRESLKNLRDANQGKTGNTPTGRVRDRDRENVSGKLPLPGSLGGGSGGGVMGGSTENLPNGVSGKEMRDGKENGWAKFTLTKSYDHAELGKNLKELRPDSLKKNKKVSGKDNEQEDWFSLSELQQRIGKLREIELSKPDDPVYAQVRNVFRSIQLEGDKNKQHYRRINVLDQPGLMQSSPPKEHLVEKYFHPDNMSAAEKLKLKLKAVRDEFKMSESDCGSTRVQIAQLTTEISHLSSMLHKKDKHSRRGLQLKVQRRKKLLKYLRRTDWDSYCFVLDKLGLRDNPDHKN